RAYEQLQISWLAPDSVPFDRAGPRDEGRHAGTEVDGTGKARTLEGRRPALEHGSDGEEQKRRTEQHPDRRTAAAPGRGAPEPPAEEDGHRDPGERARLVPRRAVERRPEEQVRDGHVAVRDAAPRQQHRA